jgi:hypothetical protein
MLMLKEISFIKKILLMAKEIEQSKILLDGLPFDSDQKIQLRRSLWVNMITSYAKMFTGKSDKTPVIRTVPRIQLDAKQCYQKVDPKYLKAHEYVMEIRNKTLAHGIENSQEHIIPVQFLKIENDHLLGNIGYVAAGSISFSDTHFPLFDEMLEIVKEFLKIRENKYYELVKKEYENIEGDVWLTHYKDKKPLPPNNLGSLRNK